MNKQKQKIRRHLQFLYDSNKADQAFQDILKLIKEFRRNNPPQNDYQVIKERFTEKDVVLITYGDQVRSPGKAPLRVLGEFLGETVGDEISILHLLPFYPYSSDDGFAVKDYRSVNPEYGSWSDINRLSQVFDLMFDAVINHVSRDSSWFRRYKKGNPEYKDFFIEIDNSWDLSNVVRPRDNPLITEIEVGGNTRSLWTTFSCDQIDLNYSNPDVLIKVIDLLLFYIEQGAKIIRLDAIAYLWKKSGTSCIHLEETHRVIRIFRAVLDVVAPHVALITETNVPHKQNISYFGDGKNEAQMVYQFTLPPLVLDAFLTANSSTLSRWANRLEFPSTGATFFNFLASHDGIGVRPAEGILPERSIDQMVKLAKKHGGAVSYKADSYGGKSPYEINISYFDALSNPQEDESEKIQIARFISSQAIMLAFRGVPGIYFHSLFGSRNWNEGVEKTGRKRSINREKLTLTELNKELNKPDSRRSRVLKQYKKLLRLRKNNQAFSPSAGQRVVDLGKELFAILRIPPNPKESILCLHNVTKNHQIVFLKPSLIKEMEANKLHDLTSGHNFPTNKEVETEILVPPYGVLWLKGEG